MLLASPNSEAEADDLLRSVRRALPREKDGRCVLLLCDLPDAPAQKTPEDYALIRRLQSGVMSIERCRPGEAMLLVRSRAWDSAAQLYLGRDQAQSPGQVIADLLTGGQTEAAFAAATRSPASLRGRFTRILIADARHFCAADVPQHMASALAASPSGCVCAAVRCMPQEHPPLLARLLDCGFSLMPEQPAAAPPAMYTPEALAKDAAPALCCDCVFAQSRLPTPADLLCRLHRLSLRGPVFPALLPILQTAALLLSALTGSTPLALLALLLPERQALRRPAKLPGALVRAALLPLRACTSLDALLMRLFAQRRLRIPLPRCLCGTGGCILMGITLLALSLCGVHALPLLLPLSLLWLFAPIILRALSLPAAERIPLTQEDLLALREQAKAQLSSLPQGDAPAVSMLCACAACMLGALEPDEAARCVERLLPDLAKALHGGRCPAAEYAAALTSAQYLREQMGACDAALRDLPAQLETLLLSAPAPQEDSLLARLLRAAWAEDSSLIRAQAARSDRAEDALFLPPVLLASAQEHPDTQPLTHPHTYLRHCAAAGGKPADSSPLRALSLASAALDHPFRALFLRSPLIAPMAAALCTADDHPPLRA